MNPPLKSRLRKKSLESLSVLTDAAIPTPGAFFTPVTEQPEPAPVAPIKPPLQPWDIAQVTSPEHGFFGVIFVVGGVSSGKVHGYILNQGMSKGFLTVLVSECEYVGSLPEGIGLVRSRTPCSEQWLKDNK